jgi:hypothetical protein
MGPTILGEPGCLRVLVLCAIWFALLIAALFSGVEWLLLGVSLSIPAIPIGLVVGSLLGGTGSKRG